MRLGVLITSIGNFGQKGFYNTQEIGLAKELDKLFDEVIVYKAVSESEKERKSIIEGCKHAVLYQIPVKSRGINGMWDCDVMDISLDALLYFSDTQLAVPKVYKWCCQNNIKLYPYIGVVESHSTNKIKKAVIDMLFKRNMNIYKKNTCFVKNPTVKAVMNNRGVKDCVIAPVGLDLSLLNQEYERTPVSEIKKKYGYRENDKILLFIGRMTEEKEPLKMIEIFKEIYATGSDYRLLMVGKGELLEAVKQSADGIKKAVCFIDRIPNKDIWELYRMADAFVNLNKQEIFGMAILEAMYYGCKVVAWKAPGPSFIIEDEKSGFLANDNQEIISKIKKNKFKEEDAHFRVLNFFTWEITASRINQYIQAIKKDYCDG